MGARRLALGAALLIAAGCGGEGVLVPQGEGTVEVRFAPAATADPSTGDDLVLTGFNGTLVITDARVIVSDFELKREAEIEDCATARPGLCSELDLAPYFLDVPLTSGVLTVGADAVAAGDYQALEFEVEDLEVDADDDAAAVAALRTQVRAVTGLADWPDRASLVLVGTFRDAQTGAVRPFKVYLDAEVEVELPFPGTLDVPADGPARILLIRIDPRQWLTFGGAVVDLSAYDYTTTGQVTEVQLNLQSGITVEVVNAS